MTPHRFLKIAKATAATFWPLVYAHVTENEATYLRSTPSTRRNLNRRLVLALAHSLLTQEQISNMNGVEIEDNQTDLTTGPTTATPLKPAMPFRNSEPRKEAHP